MPLESTTSYIPMVLSEYKAMKTNTTIDGVHAGSLGCPDADDARLVQKLQHIMMIALIAIAFACLSRLADGQSTPHPDDLKFAAHFNNPSTSPEDLSHASEVLIVQILVGRRLPGKTSSRWTSIRVLTVVMLDRRGWRI